MPLAFNSLSHGKVAFGFFNIESDMLLLEHYFFFSTDFCGLISRIAGQPGNESVSTSLSGYAITQAENIGDLMGAIHGFCFTGFIGELYRHFPFPDHPRDFKQNPRGSTTQNLVKALIAKYARPTAIPFVTRQDGLEVALGEYRFNRKSFQRLIEYVWKGGYPRWRNGIRPVHVADMKKRIVSSRNKLFHGMVI